jgi:hypothetical protein
VSNAIDYLRDDDEVWHEMPEGVQNWSENYLSGACFPEGGAGVWLHHSRPHHDQRFWEEVFTFALPGDRFLLSKGATLAIPGGNGAVGPGLTYDCVEPYKRWRKTFHGLARLVSGDEARSGPLADGPLVAVDMELDWVGAGPVFDMDMSDQVWAGVKAHYQQHCRVAGTIEFGGERLELEGFGMRDHSWGPRDLRGVGNHTWIYAEFPSGRRLMYFHHVAAGGAGLLEVGHEMDGDETTPLRAAADLPVPRDPDRWAEPYAVDFHRGDGTVGTVRGEILSGIPLAMTNLSELQLGRPGPHATHHLIECPSRIEWDGETGFGITEWSWRTDQ